MRHIFYILFLFPVLVLAQQDHLEQYHLGFPFQEGIYMNFQEFKDNQPRYQQAIERRGSDLYWYNDSLEEMVRVSPAKIWGYSQAGNIYIAYTGAYWRLISIGQLSHFSAIFISTYHTIDAYGFPVERVNKSMDHLFIDFKNGKVKQLSYKNLEPYYEQEPMYYKSFKKLKRKKQAELIKALKAYNEFYPIYFPN